MGEEVVLWNVRADQCFIAPSGQSSSGRRKYFWGIILIGPQSEIKHREMLMPFNRIARLSK